MCSTAELLTTTVAAGSRLHSVSITELRLPDPSVISLIIREGRTFVPSAETQLMTGRRAADRDHPDEA